MKLRLSEPAWSQSHGEPKLLGGRSWRRGKKAASNFQGRLLGETGDEDDPVPGGRLSAERSLTIVLCSRGRPRCPDEIYTGMRRRNRVVEVFASIVAEVEILSAASLQWAFMFSPTVPDPGVDSWEKMKRTMSPIYLQSAA